MQAQSADLPPMALTGHPDDVENAAKERAIWWGYDLDKPWTVTVRLPRSSRIQIQAHHQWPVCGVTFTPSWKGELSKDSWLAR